MKVYIVKVDYRNNQNGGLCQQTRVFFEMEKAHQFFIEQANFAKRYRWNEFSNALIDTTKLMTVEMYNSYETKHIQHLLININAKEVE